MQIIIPMIIRSFTSHSIFLKKIPMKVLVKGRPMPDITNWNCRQVSWNPYNSGQAAQYDTPYGNSGPYPGIKTDLRYYDYLSSGAGGSGVPIGEHY